MQREANLRLYCLTPETAVFAKVDSAMSYREAVLDGLRDDCPPEILERQQLLEVFYYSFDGKVHSGQIVIDERVADEVEEAFAKAFLAGFPITSVIPISKFNWDDDASMDVDNSSGFNYRTIAFTDIMSRHAAGRAIDINPRINPHYRTDGTIVPPGADYDPNRPGTLVEGDGFVGTLKKYGWGWGGNWGQEGRGEDDWQHFEKPEQA